MAGRHSETQAGWLWLAGWQEQAAWQLERQELSVRQAGKYKQLGTCSEADRQHAQAGTEEASTSRQAHAAFGRHREAQSSASSYWQASRQAGRSSQARRQA